MMGVAVRGADLSLSLSLSHTHTHKSDFKEKCGVFPQIARPEEHRWEV